MIEKDIFKLIETGEGINIEFKESKTSPTKDVYQTICAFLNRTVDIFYWVLKITVIS